MSVTSAFSDPILATCSRGSIRRCTCCDRLILTFNGASVTLTADELARMRTTVEGIRDAAAQPGAIWGWSLRTQIRGTAVVFELWDDDADLLSGVLEQALTLLNLDTLILDTLGPRPEA
ncbi:MAG: hypothetical protein AAF170_09275 [Bacteroidota bacterium]